jgi:hypothetical protein
MNNKIGKMVRKSSARFLRTHREFSAPMQFGRFKKMTFALLERDRAIGAKVGRAKSIERLELRVLHHATFERTAVQKSNRPKPFQAELPTACRQLPTASCAKRGPARLRESMQSRGAQGGVTQSVINQSNH